MATNISTVPAIVNYETWQGDSWSPGTITCDVGGTVIDFTGYSAKMEIRTGLSGDLIKTLTDTSGIMMGSDGTIVLSMTAAETNAIAAGEYRYDLQVADTNGSITTYFSGTFTIFSDITAN